MNTAGRSRTWQTVQRSPSARATAVPRTLAMRSNVSIAPLLSIAATSLRARRGAFGDRRLVRLGFALDRGALGGDFRLRRLQRRFGLLDGGVDLVGLHHVDEDALFVLPDFVADRFDLVLHGVELSLVLTAINWSLYLSWRCCAAIRSLSMERRRVLIVGEGLLGGGEGGRGGLQERVERRNPAGRLRDGFVRHRRPAFDLLQLD